MTVMFSVGKRRKTDINLLSWRVYLFSIILTTFSLDERINSFISPLNSLFFAKSRTITCKKIWKRLLSASNSTNCVYVLAVNWNSASSSGTWRLPIACEQAGTVAFGNVWVSCTFCCRNPVFKFLPLFVKIMAKVHGNHLAKRERTFSSSSTISTDDGHHDLSEQIVLDVTLEYFYKPRSLTALACLALYLMYFAFTK